MSVEITYSDPIEQGRTLSEKAVDVHIVDGADVIARWYYSPHDADLMLWFDAEGRPARFQLNSSGQIVDWNQTDGVQTGLIVEFEVRQEVAETIQFDSELNASTVSVARLVLENGLRIPESTRARMLTCLNDSRLSLKRPRVVQSRARFWNRFKHWTTGS
jgi:hypothetical protein